ncbi:hypothetical protein ACSBR2_028761 [Camellia fascicularis]
MSPPNFDSHRDLHNSANNLLHSPIIQHALVHHKQEKFVHDVSEASLRMLDVCGTTKDVLSLVKDHLQDLQSMFRRIPIGETEIENKFADYNPHRKKLKKEMLKRMRLLKGMKNNKCMMNADLYRSKPYCCCRCVERSKIDKNVDCGVFNVAHVDA